MRRNREVEAALDELARHGLTGQVDRTGRHAKVFFNTPAGQQFIVCGSTGSDGGATDIVRGRVRRMLGIAYQGGAPGQAGRKGPPATRASRSAKVAAFEPPTAAVRRDPRAALLAHPLLRHDLDRIAAAAWSAWFGAILRRHGHRPRTAAMRAP